MKCHWLACSLALCFAVPAARAQEKPKVRALTGFVQLDRARYRPQVEEAMGVLRKAKAAFEQAGYQVQTIRIATQPFPQYTGGLSRADALAFFKEYDELAAKEGFSGAIGPAMSRDSDDPANADLLAEVLRNTRRLNGSLLVAGDDGVHPKAAAAAARIMRVLSDTPHSRGNFSFAATAMVPPNAPFYPAAYAGVDHGFAIGLESANVVAEVFAQPHDAPSAERALAEALAVHARRLEGVAMRLEDSTGWKYEGLDLSPAPMRDVSIGQAIENLTHAKFGSSGTLAASALITRALRSIQVKQAGYSGLMLPIMEDTVLARRWAEGTVALDALLAYSSVCGTGLDVIPLPGDVPQERLERIITDVASLAVKLHKPLSARLLPVAGKSAGDKTEFDSPTLVNTTIRPLP